MLPEATNPGTGEARGVRNVDHLGGKIDAVDTASNYSSQVKLDLLRGDLAIQLSAAGLHLSLLGLYLETGLHDLLDEVMDRLVERMRAAVAIHKRLKSERADAALAGEAAVEFRRDRDRRKGGS